ncbi:MAG: transglycosylase SLT domain-containing protein [Oligoflexia bacterium]|nr:transglycosylase SLT domain-containing protein [Oligoflexia bacterium]
MRVNLKGYFQEIERFVNRTRTPSGDPGAARGFGSLLSEIAPDRQKSLEKAAQNRVVEPRAEPQLGPMASYNFKSPSILSPPLERVETPELQGDAVKEEGQGVKTPTLLEVRRIPRNGALSAEQRSMINKVHDLVSNAGQKHGVDPVLSMAVVSAESAFNPRAVSADGHASKGLFQLLDSTGKQFHENLELQGHYDPFNPDKNVELGVGYLRYLHDIFSRKSELPNNLATVPAENSASLEKLAVAAFNAGEGRVASAQARANKAGLNPAVYENVKTYLPDSTQDYVERVMRNKTDFEAEQQE